jgi:hypothetical protein
MSLVLVTAALFAHLELIDAARDARAYSLDYSKAYRRRLLRKSREL